MSEEKKGIGEGGKTLIQMLEERDKAYRETGYMYGLEKLELYEKNPMKLELLNSRILAALIAGRETTRMICASPLVREVAELATALYTADGTCIGPVSYTHLTLPTN